MFWVFYSKNKIKQTKQPFIVLSSHAHKNLLSLVHRNTVMLGTLTFMFCEKIWKSFFCLLVWSKSCSFPWNVFTNRAAAFQLISTLLCLIFQVGHPLTNHSHSVCVLQWQVSTKSVSVYVCVWVRDIFSPLIDYRCTSGLVGFSRQWKWAWAPPRKLDIPNTNSSQHTHTHTHTRRDHEAHFTHSNTHSRTIRHTTHLLGFQRKPSSILPASRDERGRTEREEEENREV